MKLTPSRKRRINNMDRAELLRLWRGEPLPGERKRRVEWFTGETGEYWIKRLAELGPLSMEDLLPAGEPRPGLADEIPPAVAAFFDRKLLRRAFSELVSGEIGKSAVMEFANQGGTITFKHESLDVASKIR